MFKDLPLLHRAVVIRDLERVRQLVSEGVSLNSRDKWERTPLHWAAMRDQVKIAEFLVNSCHSCTPVLRAASCGKQSDIEPFLERDSNEDNILHQAPMNNQANIAHQSSITDKVDINAVDGNGDTPLMLALCCGHEVIAALLIRAGADVHHRNILRRTALHDASFNGFTRVVRMLLEVEGLQLNPQDHSGNMPLHCACRNGYLPVMKQLLEAGADPNIINSDGKTALSVALKQNWRNVDFKEIKLLVDKGGFLDAFDYERVSRNAVLKDRVLKDVDLCTQSVVNRYHHQSLPALGGIPHLAGRLPRVKKFELPAECINDVKICVERDIQANTFCNVVTLRPFVLSMMCVETLLASQRGRKRSAPSEFSEANPSSKKRD